MLFHMLNTGYFHIRLDCMTNQNDECSDLGVSMKFKVACINNILKHFAENGCIECD